MTRKDAVTTRKENLRILIAEWQGPANLAKKLGLSGSSYLSQIMGGHRPFSEKTARMFEAKLNLDRGWLDQSRTVGQPDFVGYNPELLATVIIEVKAAPGGASLPPRKFCDIVILGYEQAVKDGNVDTTHLRRLVSLAATK
jgi:hypothetical protein